MKETDIVKEIQVGLAGKGVRLFRNNTGGLFDKAGRFVRFGLVKGGSDLVGGTPVKITPEMIGRVLFVLTAVEVKRPGKKPTPEQVSFIDMVQSSGGIAFVAHSLDEAENKMMNI